MSKKNDGQNDGQKERSKLSPSEQRLRHAVWMVVVLLVLVLASALALTINNNIRLGAILEDSVESELITTSVAARDKIDIDLFKEINNIDDLKENQEEVDALIEDLRALESQTGATYIYALKEINGKYYFIFDTDKTVNISNETQLIEYQLSQVHRDALEGKGSASIMNVRDRFGTFNTGAVPLWDNGRVIGLVAADYEDHFIRRNQQTALFDAALLVIVLLLSLGFLFGFVLSQLRSNQKMEQHLYNIANHDATTGLPNRNQFFTYFDAWVKTDSPKNAKFGLLFIDLDNFKSVNDGAGHDAGDLLLKRIALFMNGCSERFPKQKGIEAITARIGGDEFIQVVPGVSTPEELEQIARNMLNNFQAEKELQQFIQGYGVGLSIGGSLFPLQTTSYNELVRLADIAMYSAKYGGKNNYVFYDASMGDNVEGVSLSIRNKRRQDQPA
jgi:diguanylate cyclase (GGDEF)-like protein